MTRIKKLTAEGENLIHELDKSKSHLDELGSLHLLTAFTTALVPESVWQEVGRHRPAVLVVDSIHTIRDSTSDTLAGGRRALSALVAAFGPTAAPGPGWQWVWHRGPEKA